MAKTYVSLADIVDTTALSVDETADEVTIPIKATIGSGDLLDRWGATNAAKRLDVRLGTSASPDTGSNVPVKVSRTVGHVPADLGPGDNSNILNAMSATAKGTSGCGVQPIAVFGAGLNAGTTTPSGGKGPDAVGGYFTSEITGSGIGVGIGACVIGTYSSSAGAARGMELAVFNDTASDETAGTTNISRSQAIWMHAGNARRVGTGIEFGNPFGAQFDVGIKFGNETASDKFSASHTGATRTADIATYSSSTTALLLNGSHTTGVDLSGGTFSGSAVRAGSGDLFGTFGASSEAAKYVDLRLGTSGAPDILTNPPLKVCRTIGHTQAQLEALTIPNADGSEQLASIVAMNKGTATAQVQPVGVYGSATSVGTSEGAAGGAMPDSVGGYFVGMIQGSGVGTAIGVEAVSRTDSTTGKMASIEIATYQNSGADHTLYANGFNSSQAIWMTAGGRYRVSVGIHFGCPAGSQFQTGILFNGQTGTDDFSNTRTGPTNNEDIRSNSNAVKSILINGSHTYGIDTVGGTFSAGPIRLPNESAIVARNAANSADVELIKLNSINEVHFQTTVRVNTWMQLGDGVAIETGTTNGSKIGFLATQKLGFWGATPIARPANTSDLKDVLEATGLMASGGATPLNLDGGTLSVGVGNFTANVTNQTAFIVNPTISLSTSFAAGANISPIFKPTVGSLTQQYALQFIPTISDNAGVSNSITGPIHGIFARVDLANTYTGTVDTAHGITLPNPSKNGGSGVVTTYKGLHIDTLNIAGTNWGIYVNTNESFFGGNVRLGASANFMDSTGATIKRTFQAVFEAKGNLTTGVGTGKFKLPNTGTPTITEVSISVDTKPTTQNVIVDLNSVNATTNARTSLYTSATKPQITPAGNFSAVAALPDTTQPGQGVEISIDIDQVGSGTVGANLVVTVKGTY